MSSSKKRARSTLPVPEGTVRVRMSFPDTSTAIMDELPDAGVLPPPEPTVRINLFGSLRVAAVDPVEGEQGAVVSALRGLGAPCTAVKAPDDVKPVVTEKEHHTVFVMVHGDEQWACDLLQWGMTTVPRLHWIPVLMKPSPTARTALRLAGAVEILELPLPSPMGLLLRAAGSAPYDLPPFVTQTEEFLRELGTYWRQHEDAVAAFRALLRERLRKTEESRERMRRAVEKMAQKQRDYVDEQFQAIELKSSMEEMKKSAMEVVVKLAASQQNLYQAQEEVEIHKKRVDELEKQVADARAQEEKLRGGELAEARRRVAALDEEIKGLQKTLTADNRRAAEMEAEVLHARGQLEGLAEACREVLEAAVSLGPLLGHARDFLEALQQMRTLLKELDNEPPMVVGRLT